MNEITKRDKPLILIASEDHVLLTEVGLRLRESDYDVVEAADGAQALELAADLIPDLAVLDVTMPRVDGFEVTERMRANRVTARIPVILLAAQTEDADLKRGFQVGADEYITKPFDPEELPGRVAGLLDGAAT